MDLLLLKDRRFDKSLRNIPHWMLVPPVAFSLLGMAPAALIGYLAGLLLDLPFNKPTKDSPHSTLWLVIFLVAMTVCISLGYVAGFIVDALLLRFVHDWPWAKIKDLMLYSKLPPEWSAPTTPVRD